MSKMQMLIAIPVMVLVVIFAGIWLFVLPPSVEKICKKTFELAAKELETSLKLTPEAAQKMVGEKRGSMDTCVSTQQKARDRSTKSIFYHRSSGNCIVKADSLKNAMECISELDKSYSK